jgi:hypothetical protein
MFGLKKARTCSVDDDTKELRRLSGHLRRGSISIACLLTMLAAKEICPERGDAN